MNIFDVITKTLPPHHALESYLKAKYIKKVS
jgi:hypothetical protein